MAIIRSPSFAVGLLAAVGGVWVASRLYKVATFAHLHFIRQSSLQRYQQGTNEAWALVTGASGGIGKGFAEELCEHGFNIILHGRNEERLERVRVSLLERWPERDVKLLVIDAADAWDEEGLVEAAVRRFSDLSIQILVNNVAGAPEPLWATLDSQKSEDVTRCLRATSQFPTDITRALLPNMLKHQPALVINIGSGVSELPAPYISVYAGAKAHNKAWSRSLAVEMKAEGHDVEVLLIQVGMVSTNAAPRPTSLLVPSARHFAKCSLNKVGCGLSEVWAYWPHALEYGGVILNLPDWVMQRVVINIAKSEKAIEEAALMKGK